ncbi:hypothetical protein Tco_0994330 [Tanacetum coccineum]
MSQQNTYELLHDRKPNLSYLHVFGALCYPTNNDEDLDPETPSPIIPLSLDEVDYDIEVAHMDNNPYIDFLIPKLSSEESSLQIEAIQEELNEFECLEVWELVPHPDHVMIITLKWIYKKFSKGPQGKSVDPIHYRGMIGTLMYLTSNRPDLDSCIALTAFADADHAGCQDTKKLGMRSMSPETLQKLADEEEA